MMKLEQMLRRFLESMLKLRCKYFKHKFITINYEPTNVEQTDTTYACNTQTDFICKYCNFKSTMLGYTFIQKFYFPPIKWSKDNEPDEWK